MSENIVNIVNSAIDTYNSTDAEAYPEARAIDKLEELTPPNSRDRQYAYNLFNWWLDNKDKTQ